jgi:hypothetical protein
MFIKKIVVLNIGARILRISLSGDRKKCGKSSPLLDIFKIY